MKKILALVLAVLMLTTVAFAAETPDGEEGTQNMVWSYLDEAGTPWPVYPGAKIEVANDIMDYLWQEWDKNARSMKNHAKRFEVDIEFSKGEELIKDIYWNGNDYLVELKDFDDITDLDNDIVVQTVTVKLKEDIRSHYLRLQKDDEGKMVFASGAFNGEQLAPDDPSWGNTDIELSAIWDVGYDYWELDSSDTSELDRYDDFSGSWKAGIGNKDLRSSPNTPYYKNMDKQPLKIELADIEPSLEEFELDVSFTLQGNEWFKLTSLENGRGDYDAMLDAADALTKDAGYSYVFGFEGSQLSANRAFFTLDADENAYIYELDMEGNPSVSAFRWDEDAEHWRMRTRDLNGCYLLCDIELAAAPAIDNSNPDTGANSVAGIAVALAVAATLCAAAISLKK